MEIIEILLEDYCYKNDVIPGRIDDNFDLEHKTQNKHKVLARSIMSPRKDNDTQQHNRIQNHFEQRETTIKKTETLTIEDKKAIFILGGTMWH